jgi:hypothetical protein
MYKLFVDDKTTTFVLAFEPQYVPSNGAVLIEPSYILRNVSLQLGMVSSLKLNKTLYVSASVINKEQYCERGSISLTAALCDLNEPLEPVIVRRHSEIELKDLKNQSLNLGSVLVYSIYYNISIIQ